MLYKMHIKEVKPYTENKDPFERKMSQGLLAGACAGLFIVVMLSELLYV